MNLHTEPIRRGIKAALYDGAFVFAMMSGGCLLDTESSDQEDDPEEEEDAAVLDLDTEIEPSGGPEGSSRFECCVSHHAGGCNDASTESCVCGLDPACCTDSWDETCVLTATNLCQRCG